MATKGHVLAVNEETIDLYVNQDEYNFITSK